MDDGEPFGGVVIGEDAATALLAEALVRRLHKAGPQVWGFTHRRGRSCGVMIYMGSMAGRMSISECMQPRNSHFNQFIAGSFDVRMGVCEAAIWWWR